MPTPLRPDHPPIGPIPQDGLSQNGLSQNGLSQIALSKNGLSQMLLPGSAETMPGASVGCSMASPPQHAAKRFYIGSPTTWCDAPRPRATSSDARAPPARRTSATPPVLWAAIGCKQLNSRRPTTARCAARTEARFAGDCQSALAVLGESEPCTRSVLRARPSWKSNLPRSWRARWCTCVRSDAHTLLRPPRSNALPSRRPWQNFRRKLARRSWKCCLPGRAEKYCRGLRRAGHLPALLTAQPISADVVCPAHEPHPAMPLPLQQGGQVHRPLCCRRPLGASG